MEVDAQNVAAAGSVLHVSGRCADGILLGVFIMLEVSGWERWQTYRKDRGTPPWVKVYRNLLSNPEWAELTDSEKGQLVSIWLVAADKQGLIPKNPRVIRKICLLDDDPNINKFIDLGFLTTACQPGGNQLPTINAKSDAPETETETETEKPLRESLKSLHVQNFGEIGLTPTHLSVFKRWEKEGREYGEIRTAYEQTAGSRGNGAARWRWITDIVEGRPTNSGSKRAVNGEKKRSSLDIETGEGVDFAAGF